MKRSIRVVLFSLFSALVVAPLAGAQGPMTLDEAIRIAQEQSFDVQRARADVEKAIGARRQATAFTLPSLSFDSTYTRFTREVSVQFDPMQPPIVVRPIDRSNLSLNLRQAVDLSGVFGLGIAGARAQIQAAEAALQARLNEVALNVRTAFYNVLSAKEIQGVAEERVANAQEALRTAKARFEAGTAPRFDVLRFESELKAAEQEKIQAENGLRLAIAAFNLALSRDTGTPIELVPPDEALPSVPDLDEAIAAAKQERPEVRAAESLITLQENIRRAQERQLSPTLNLTATASRDPQARGFGAEKDTVSVTAVFSWPLFDSGRVRAVVHQAKQDELQARIALNQLKLGIELEVRQAWLDLTAAQQAIETARLNVEFASEAYRLAQVRYSGGVGTPLEVSDATVALARARASLVAATYDYRKAYARLQKAVGKEKIS
jgi:outer membrane protein TolC